MSTLSATRCFRHGQREASGQCLSCRQYYCRECLVVLEGKLTCANCMVAESESIPKTSVFKRALFVLSFAWGIFVLWFLFYSVGRILLTIPDMFHASYLS